MNSSDGSQAKTENRIKGSRIRKSGVASKSNLFKEEPIQMTPLEQTNQLRQSIRVTSAK